MKPALTLLARGKVLRETRLDPFAYTAERRAERKLASEYAALIEQVLDRLEPENLEAGIKLLSLVESVRGYGPVKAEAMIAYRQSLKPAVSAFNEATANKIPLAAAYQ